MCIFFIGDAAKCGQLISQCRINNTRRLYLFDGKNLDFSKAETAPDIIIIYSSDKESWNWWITGELIFRFPETFLIFAQLSTEQTKSKNVSHSIFLIIGSEMQITGQVTAQITGRENRAQNQ